MPASCRARRHGSPRTAAARSGAIAVGQVMRSGRRGGSGRPTPRGGAAASRISPDVTGRGLAPRYRPAPAIPLPMLPERPLPGRRGAPHHGFRKPRSDISIPLACERTGRIGDGAAKVRRHAAHIPSRASGAYRTMRPPASEPRATAGSGIGIDPRHTHTEAERPARHAALAERKPAPGRSLAPPRRACHLHDTRRNAAPAGRRRAASR